MQRRRLGFLILLALILRLRQLGRAFEYDEQFSWLLAQQPLQTLLAAARGDVHPPLYYLVLSSWGAVFGYSEVSLRTPSLLAGLGVVALVYRLGCKLNLGDVPTFAGALIAAVSPFQVFYSQQARMYELETLAFLIAVTGLVEGRRWMLISGSLATMYLHNLGPVVVAVLFLAGWLWRRDRRAHLVDCALVAVGFLPGLAGVWYQTTRLSAGYWISSAGWLGLADLLHAFSALIFDRITGHLGFVLILLTVIALLVVIHDLVNGQGRSRRLLAALSLGPAAVLAVVSLVWHPVLLYRSVSPCAPLFYLLVASILTSERAWRRWLLSAIVALALAVTAHGQFIEPVKRNDVVSWGDLRAGDGVYSFLAGSYVTYTYARGEPDVLHVVAPMERDLTGGGLSAETVAALGLEQRELGEVLCRAPAWTLLWFEGDEPVAPDLGQHFQDVLSTYEPRLTEIETATEPDVGTGATYRLDSTPFCEGGK